MIFLLCNNYACTYDGIGAYCQKIYKRYVDNGLIVLFNGNTKPKGRLYRFFSSKMIFKSFDLLKELKKNNNVNSVVIEYPFIECNPLLIFPIILIKNFCNRKNIKFVISLHEYSRTNLIRKIIIKQIVRKSDLLFTTDNETKQIFKKIVKRSMIREIPANIYNGDEIDFQNKDRYCFAFFGLINKSKAVHEMIEAWNKFVEKNPQLPLKLKIITSTEFDCSIIKNCTYHHNLSDEEINNELSDTSFAILPIRPRIGLGNATLKTLMSNGCITIGLFSNDLINKYPESFLETIDLSTDSLFNTINSTVYLDKRMIDEMRINSKKYSFEFNPIRLSDKLIKNLSGVYYE